MRRYTLQALYQTSALATNNFGYDAASRLQSVSDGVGNSAAYSYLANSPLVSQITFTNSGALRMTTTKQYDFLNRLTSISSVGTGSSPSPISFAYTYNNANQRTRNVEADGSYWVYLYDSLGQAISGHKFWSDESPVAGQQFDYSFDNIGNRTQALAGGDQNGLNQRVATYTANNLNQYTNRTAPGFVDIMGLAMATNPVTVNGTVAYRKGEYFRQQLAVNNSSSAAWQGATNSAAGQTTVTGHLFVPQTPESFTYDADGNLIQDGRWTYTWDGENRLIDMTSLTNAPAGSQLKLDFAYDYRGRRIQKIVSTFTNSAYVPQSTNRLLYDGWNLIAELAPNASLIRSYVWGLDLSGSLQGAGGVGGLLELTYRGAQTTNCFAAYDGNGNVAGLINAADASLAAQYDYGPFGEVLRETGPMAKTVPFRFSARYQDEETGLFAYPRRPYDPSQGRFLCKDPSGESGGHNLYALARNTLGVDPFGLVELHYIDHPKWQQIDLRDRNDPHVSEFFWVGHYLTFDSSDAANLPGGSGWMLENERSEASITDCNTGNTVFPRSRNLFFANLFSLNSAGSVVTQSDPDAFDNGQLYLFTQMDNFSMAAMYRKCSHASGEVHTKGWIHTRLEIHVIARDYDLNAEPWIPWMQPPGYSTADIDGHQMGRRRWGMMAGGAPQSWSVSGIYSQTVDVNFKWDDCLACGGGKLKWDYKVTPLLTQPGRQRERYVGATDFDSINLLTNPSNW